MIPVLMATLRGIADLARRSPGWLIMAGIVRGAVVITVREGVYPLRHDGARCDAAPLPRALTVGLTFG